MVVSIYPTVNRKDNIPKTQIGLNLSVDQLSELLNSQITHLSIDDEARQKIKEALELNRPLEFAIVSHMNFKLEAKLNLISTIGEIKTITLQNHK